MRIGPRAEPAGRCRRPTPRGRAASADRSGNRRTAWRANPPRPALSRRERPRGHAGVAVSRRSSGGPVVELLRLPHALHAGAERIGRRAEGDGLGENEVLSMVTSPDGSVWFGTYSQGISQYDGKAWTSIQTEDDLYLNQVTALAISPDGTLWGGLARGAFSYHDAAWQIYTDSLGNTVPYVLAVYVSSDSTVWIATLDRLFTYQDGMWTNFQTMDPVFGDINSITSSKDGSMWFGTVLSGVIHLEKNVWTILDEAQGLPSNMITSIQVLEDDTIWVATEMDGVAYFNGEQWEIYTEGDGLVSNQVQAIAVAPDQSLWVGTGDGVSHFDGHTWVNYTKAYGLPNNSIHDIAIADDASIWFPTS